MIEHLKNISNFPQFGPEGGSMCFKKVSVSGQTWKNRYFFVKYKNNRECILCTPCILYTLLYNMHSFKYLQGKYWINDYIIKTTHSLPYLPLGTFKFEYIFNRIDVRVLFEVTFKIESFIKNSKIVPFWL